MNKNLALRMWGDCLYQGIATIRRLPRDKHYVFIARNTHFSRGKMLT